MTVCLLEEAEALELRSAGERVAYYRKLILPMKNPVGEPTLLLDVGCGNGYAVAEWRKARVRAIGIDASLYRFSRWVAQHPGERPFVVANAAALPFRSGVAAAVVASGMLEHIGVMEERTDRYRVSALPARDPAREAVVRELLRVTAPGSALYLDFPNGSFPVDFWHGDDIASFRWHRIPDPLCPDFWSVRLWAKRSGATVTLHRLHGRLQFRQVGTRRAGRILTPPMKAFLRLLDAALSFAPARLLAAFYPFLVLSLRLRPPNAASASERSGRAMTRSP